MMMVFIGVSVRKGLHTGSRGVGLPVAMGNWLRAARDRDARQRLEALGGNG